MGRGRERETLVRILQIPASACEVKAGQWGPPSHLSSFPGTHLQEPLRGDEKSEGQQARGPLEDDVGLWPSGDIGG